MLPGAGVETHEGEGEREALMQRQYAAGAARRFYTCITLVMLGVRERAYFSVGDLVAC